MFSETRYAMNGDLRVAYRASAEGERDIVFVCNPITSCEIFPELPSAHGWFEAMTSLGRVIYFDVPGTGVSDPATWSLELWADSIMAVLDDLGSGEAVLVAIDGSFVQAALFVAVYPSRTSALVVLEGYADPLAERTQGLDLEETVAAYVAMWGDGSVSASIKSGHAVERGNSGSLGTARTLRGKPRVRCANGDSDCRVECAASAPGNPRAYPCRPPRRRPGDPAGMG